MWSRSCRPATAAGTSLSVDPVDQRLYVGRPDGVTAIDLKTGKATDRIVPGQRVHAALAIPARMRCFPPTARATTHLCSMA